ncbi:MAG: nucleotidyltransferase family protein [Candidatus Choladocola sp.]|nr:nucleotidyltransferase family protein [Candidatus Choladocola sp.]
MNAVGIVAEYNPFHTGHRYHLEQAKKCSGAEYCIVIMSPDFVQRGEPALFDKYTRTGMALMGGADLVLELPVCYATGSAEYFAQGSTALLQKLGVVSSLCFGSETDDPSLFPTVSEILNEEPEDYRTRLRDCLREGMTFPQARSAALGDAYAEFLSTPNNILGLEYCKALKKMNSSIHPHPIRRKGDGFHSESLNGEFCSATAIRSAVCGSLLQYKNMADTGSTSPSTEAVLSYIPEESRKLFLSSCSTIVLPDDLMMHLTGKLLSRSAFDDIFDISPELSDRIRTLRFSLMGNTWEETVTKLKTRQITEARIRRALLHLILGIDQVSVDTFRKKGTVFYGRILGFRKSAAPLLHEIRQKADIPLISKTSRASLLLDDTGKQMWEQDLFASHLYRSIRAVRYHLPFRTEYEYSPVIL